MITALSLLLFALLVVCVVQIATSSDIGYVDPTICSWESVRLFALLWHATVRCTHDHARREVGNASCRRQLLKLESGIIVS